MCHSVNGTSNAKGIKKVQYVTNATPVDSHDSFVSNDDICLLTIHSDNKIIIHPVLNGKQAHGGRHRSH